MERIELTHGQWAELRPAETITNRARRPVQQILTAEEPGTLGRGTRAAEALLPWLIAAWSLDLPLPSEQPQVLDDLLGHDYDRLLKAASDRFVRLFEQFEVDPDPNPPGGSSNGSASAPEEMPPSSTPAGSPSSTAPTSSAASSAGP